MMINRIVLKLISMFIFLILICTNSALGKNIPDYWPTDGWRKASPEQKGMDSEKLIKMLQIMKSYPVDSVTIIRDGYIVLDVYQHPYQAGRLHNILSCTKSITPQIITKKKTLNLTGSKL